MSHHNRNLSFTTPVLVSIAGILISFLFIAVSVTLNQKRNSLDYIHKINRNFTRNLAINCQASLLKENNYILSRTATYLSRNDQLNNIVNNNHKAGLQNLMHLLALMPMVTSIIVADDNGHYVRAPEVMLTDKGKAFDVRQRPWFIHQAEASPFSHYTEPYPDYFAHHTIVTIYRPVISPEGSLKGTVAFDLDTATMSSTLRQMQTPVQGEFFIVDRSGKVLLHPDTGARFKPYVDKTLMARMTSGEGSIYDNRRRSWYYYYSFTNPDWFVIFKVQDATLDDATRQGTLMTTFGFGLAIIIVLLFALYLRHASHSVLMNIINAIKTGDVKRTPRLEAMLSKAIQSNKERELIYIRQATIDALTGCKNRRAFDVDIAARINAGQPFALALIDVDNFKTINDTRGHLSGDIVLRQVAREGMDIMLAHNIAVYRYGGEEFAAIFPAEQIAASMTLLETWRLRIAQRAWREEGLTVTFSAGLGEWRFSTSEAFIGSVDDALYRAKQQGKNRILRTFSD